MKSEKSILLVMLISFLSLLFSCQNNSFKMSSNSMSPTIKNGEIISADLSIYDNQKPERWDVVLFQSSALKGKDWTMRIVGLPGEVVSFDSLGLSIDGKNMNSNKFGIKYEMHNENIDSSKQISHPYTIQQNHFYLLGDNVNDAYDSRFWGAISADSIFGKVTLE